jgi:hypothetical protein
MASMFMTDTETRAANEMIKKMKLAFFIACPRR